MSPGRLQSTAFWKTGASIHSVLVCLCWTSLKKINTSQISNSPLFTSEVKQHLVYCNSPSELIMRLNVALLFLRFAVSLALRLNSSSTLGWRRLILFWSRRKSKMAFVFSSGYCHHFNVWYRVFCTCFSVSSLFSSGECVKKRQLLGNWRNHSDNEMLVTPARNCRGKLSYLSSQHNLMYVCSFSMLTLYFISL